MKNKFEPDHQMTVKDMIDYLSDLEPSLPLVTSIFRPMEGLMYKQPVKFSQVKRGRDCVYVNNYLSK